MPVSTRYSLALFHCFRTIHKVLVDLCRFVLLFTRPRVAVAAENLFLRKQLALFQERKLKPHRATDSTRWLMAFLSRVFDWRSALVEAFHTDAELAAEFLRRTLKVVAGRVEATEVKFAEMCGVPV